MTQPEDLRLGNLITAEGEVFTVDKISEKSVHAGALGVTRLGFMSEEYGIPITEDWLIKFGFDKFESYDFGGSLKVVPRFELNDISIQLSDSEFWYTRLQYDGGTSESFEPVIEVNFVHQLQNLTFALTGEELKLN